MADTNRSAKSKEESTLVAELRQQEHQRKHRILDKLEVLGVLKDLTPTHQMKLAGLVLKISDAHRTRDRAWTRQEDKSSPGKLRMLSRKATKLREAFEELVTYAAGIGIGVGAPEERRGHLADDLDDMFDLRSRLEAIASAIGDLYVPPWVKPGSSKSANDLTIPATQVLFDFFTGKGRIARNNATQRIAKIENAFWGGNIRENDDSSHTQDRSDAVRKRLKRNEPPSTAR
jgi:hypothetical protein